MVIVHYHIFKNAGTSVDVMLQQNFGDRWTEIEFPEPDPEAPPGNPLGDFLRARPDLVAVSSHTAQLPPPSPDVFPILFLRHPLDRLRSAYEFERVQEADTHGAWLAKRHDFAGYVRELLAVPEFRQARNFQTQRLAANEPPEAGSERERALRALETLPFVGLVENYAQCAAQLAERLRVHFPDFTLIAAHENRTEGRRDSLEARLAAMREELPEALWEELLAANADDFAVWEAAKPTRTGFEQQ